MEDALFPNLTIEQFIKKEEFSFSMLHTSHQYGDILNMHTHDFIELGYVTHGRGIHVMQNSAMPLSKGDVYIIKKGVAHQIVVYEEDKQPLFIYNCIFNPIIFEEYAPCLQIFEILMENKIDQKISDDISLNLQAKFDKMFQEMNEQKKGYQSYICTTLFQILIELERKLQDGNAQDTNSLKRDMIKKSISYINQHIRENIRIKEVAANVYLSSSQFSKIFKVSVGKTVHDFIEEKKIELAKNEIQNGTPFAQTACCCGYTEYSTFFRAFKKITGVSPKIYIKG